MASSYSASYFLAQSHAVLHVQAPSHDGLHSRNNFARPQKLSFTKEPTGRTIGKQATSLGVSTALSISLQENQRPKRVGPKPRVILIAGPTAVGKTRLSIGLAKALGGEIINADSVQVYQGMDVGSAKAPLEERQGIPHHLLDVVPPTRDYIPSEFLLAARTATEHILAKGKVPIVVGGTGLYMRTYVHNRPHLTSHPFEGELHARGEMHAQSRDYDFQSYFLYQHRADLYPRVDIRCEQMVPALLSETSWLMSLGVEPDSNAAARALGYEEATLLLLDARKNDGYISEQRFLRFLNEFQSSSKELVRKQIEWFRSETRSEVRQFKWIAADRSPVENMVECLAEEYRRAPGESSRVSSGQDLRNASLMEQRRLKQYRAALCVYCDPAAVAGTLAWIRNTQARVAILQDIELPHTMRSSNQSVVAMHEVKLFR